MTVSAVLEDSGCIGEGGDVSSGGGGDPGCAGSEVCVVATQDPPPEPEPNDPGACAIGCGVNEPVQDSGTDPPQTSTQNTPAPGKTKCSQITPPPPPAQVPLSPITWLQLLALRQEQAYTPGVKQSSSQDGWSQSRQALFGIIKNLMVLHVYPLPTLETSTTVQLARCLV